MKKPEANYQRYLNTNSGARLLTEHSLTDYGMWVIKGEDPNCDFHGSHHQPILGYREGQLKDVIAEAVEMNGFWEWGAGGSFEKIKMIQANPENAKRIVALKRQREELELQLEVINKQLGE